MSAPELVTMSAAEQVRRVRAGDVTARELAQAHLDRIEATDAALGAFLRVDRDGALARADAVDAAVAQGDDPGLLAGLPVAVKDIFVTEGLETTAASRILAGWVPPYDGTAVARLRAAGAVILGKLNMDEFAMGSSTEGSAYGPCRNPWDTERVPGGSSGGSAAAVAAMQCAASLGTDTGGSIRQPAAMCGVVGIKPTYGRVSRYGVIAFASSLDQVGPLARTVEDAALMLEAIAGHDPRDATSIEAPCPRYRDALDRGVDGLVIGVPDEWLAAGADPEVIAAVHAAADVLASLGAKVRPVSLPHTDYALPAYYLIAPAEASSNLARYDGIRYGVRDADAGADLLATYCESRGRGFGAEVKRRIMLGTFALRSGYYDAYYGKAQKVRALIKRDFDRVFEGSGSGVDAVLGPVAPTTAFRLGEKMGQKMGQKMGEATAGATADPLDMYRADVFTLSCNLAGLPGMSVPCGFDAAGLPIGLQLIGKPLAEDTLVAIAAAYEREARARGVTVRELPDLAGGAAGAAGAGAGGSRSASRDQDGGQAGGRQVPRG